MKFKNLKLRLIRTKNPYISEDEKFEINNLITTCIEQQCIPKEVQEGIIDILEICNIIYNNAPNTLSPVNDVDYDKIIVLCKNLGIQYPIGSIKVDFKTENSMINSEGKNKYIDNKLEIVQQIPDIQSYKFFIPLAQNLTLPRKEDFVINHDNTLIERRTRTATSNYGLCGTLDKCKFVTIQDALEKSNEAISGTVSIFQRDFLDKHIKEGLIDPNNIELILSLKYDGFSVENEVLGDTIIYSCTRGNVNTNQTVDMTPIFGGMKFSRASGLKDKFAIKFEYIITNQNMELIKRNFGKEYVNNRNAVSGLIGGLDARLYRDYLTPVPIESSLDMDRLEEIRFLNLHYTKGIDFKHVYIKGDYNQILYMIKQFVKETDSLRDYLQFMIDGIVVEYRDRNIRNKLGIKNSIPQYATAIKFDPMKKISTFKYYKFTIGSDGRITPMAYFEPVDFMGATHSFTTAHSYERFKQLNLKPGDKVILSLVNDVILYITKAPEEYQDPNNTNPIIEFPKVCPSCGTPIEFSNTNKIAYCPNMNCPERKVNRLGNMIKKLGIRDFAVETIRNLNVNSFYELYNFNEEEAKIILGPLRAVQLKDALIAISENVELTDYQIFGSIGFSNIAEKTWKLILKRYSAEDILNGKDISDITQIKGIGNSIYNTIQKELPYFIDDLRFLFKTFLYKNTTGDNEERIEICFSGIRDKNIEALAYECGYETNENLTSNTSILIVPYIGFTASGKIKRVFSMYSKKYHVLHNTTDVNISWDNIDLIKPYGFKPEIMDIYSFKALLNMKLENLNF